jgi:ribosomal protein S18 acetylase RimI-like enzyme
MDEKLSTLLVESPRSAEVAAVRRGLREFNTSLAGDDNHQRLTVFLRDQNDAVVGGLLGGTYWGYLYIEALWISEPFRHRGHGKQLLQLAEEEAVKRGCRQAHLDTQSFQAVDFYRKQGYLIVGELADLPPGYSKYLMTKVLLVNHQPTCNQN